jgi:hypothetical protein
MSNAFVAARLASEMKRFGITAPRLARCARANGVTATRARQALRGEPGHLRAWQPGALADWLEMIRTAWQF